MQTLQPPMRTHVNNKHPLRGVTGVDRACAPPEELMAGRLVHPPLAVGNAPAEETWCEPSG